jgi:acyl-CoA hydrolase
MSVMEPKEWKSKLVAPRKVLSKIKPGMSIFLGTGVAEPCTLVQSLLDSDAGNLRDLGVHSIDEFWSRHLHYAEPKP